MAECEIHTLAAASMWLFSLLTACSDPPPPPPPPAPPPVEPAPAPAPDPAPLINAPPRLTGAKITPFNPTPDDPLRLEVLAEDPDKDPVVLDITWTVNGERRIDLVGEALPRGTFKRGDVVAATITARDGKAEVSLDVPAITFQNRSPVVETDPRALTRFTKSLQLQASDPDGDTLAWSVTGAPPGLSITPKGLLSYTPSTDAPSGEYRAKIRVEDGNGGWGELELPLTIHGGSPGPGTAPR